MTQNDRTDAIIFRVTLDAITDLLTVFMKQYQRYKDSKWFARLKTKKCCTCTNEEDCRCCL